MRDQFNSNGSGGVQTNHVYNGPGPVDQRQYTAGGDINQGDNIRTSRVEGTGHRIVQGEGRMEGDRPTTNTRTVNITVWAVGGIGIALVAAKAHQAITQQDNALAALADAALQCASWTGSTAFKGLKGLYYLTASQPTQLPAAAGGSTVTQNMSALSAAAPQPSIAASTPLQLPASAFTGGDQQYAYAYAPSQSQRR